MTSFVTACSILLSVLFTLSGLPKLRRIHRFVDGINEYRIIPQRLARPVAWVAVGAELLGASLLWTPWVRFGASVLLVLIVSYSLAVAINLYRKADIKCHCFEQLRDSRLSPVTLIRLLLLLSFTVTCFVTPPTLSAVRSWFEVSLFLLFQTMVLLVLEVMQQALTTTRALSKHYQQR